MSATIVPSVRKDRVRVYVLMAKKSGISDEQFYKHWHEVHGPLFRDFEIVKKNLLKYEQHPYTSQFDDGIKTLGFAVSPYQGVAIFEAESFDKIFACLSSEEYLAVGVPDEQTFVDRSRTVVIPGSLLTYIDTNAKE